MIHDRFHLIENSLKFSIYYVLRCTYVSLNSSQLPKDVKAQIGHIFNLNQKYKEKQCMSDQNLETEP